MATQTIVSITDDIDGTDAEGTVRFALDGADYEIDLNSEHHRTLRETLGRYIDAARRTGPPRGRHHAPPRNRQKAARPLGTPVPQPAFIPAVPLPDNQVIRGWAKSQNIPVKERGRIPAEVIAAWRSAH